MELGLGTILLLISLISVVPYVLVVLLKFFMWKFGFTARVNGFMTLSEIMLRVPLHLNFALMVRIERVSLSFSLTAHMLKVSVYGFQIYLLARNDFNLWKTRKIEILHMLEDIKTSLKRKGLLKTSLSLAKGGFHSKKEVKEPNASQEAASNLSGNSLAPKSYKSNQKFLERMLNRLLTSFEVKLTDTIINFVAYVDDDKKIEEANLKKFYHTYLLDREFRDQSLCFRVLVPQGEISVKQINDDDMDLHIEGGAVLLQNPTCMNKQGVLKDVSLLLKVPLDLKLAKDFCNFDLRMKILRGSLNVNKRFIRSLTRFLVIIDTTKGIISRVKRLITKLHYQDDLLLLMMQPPGTTGVENLYMPSEAYVFENVKDIDIPKRLKVVIEEGLTITVCEYSKKLKPFLSRHNPGKERESELIILNTNQLTFELLRTLKDSYYLQFFTDRMSIDANMRRSVQIDRFSVETDFSYKRPLSNLPITTQKMEISNQVKLEGLQCDLTLSEVKFVLDIVDIYQEMVCIASIKNVIMSTLLDKEFLKNNLLHMGSEDPNKESQIMLLFQEPKNKDSLVNDVLVGKLTGKVLTYDQRNILAVSAQKYQLRLKVEKGVDEFTSKVEFLQVQPVQPKSIALVKIESLTNTFTASRGHETAIRDICTVFEKCHLSLNIDYLLGLAPEIIDLTVIMKTYSRKWNLKYRVKDYIKQTIIEQLHFQFQETQFLWHMSQCRYLVFSFEDFTTRPSQSPFKKEDRISLCYFARECALYYVLVISDHAIPGTYFCVPSEEKKISTLLELGDLELKLISTATELKMRYVAKQFKATLPEDIHFCGLVFEMVKQLAVSRKWFLLEYAKVKKKYNVQFQKIPPPSMQPFSISQQLVPATAGRRQTLLIQIDCQDVLIEVDDTSLKQLFVNKNELVDTLQERDIFKCRGQNIFKLLKKLKQSKLNEKVLILQGKSFKMTYDLPQKYLDFNQVYLQVMRLDEAKDFMNPGLFSSFEGANHSYKMDYVSFHSRNMLSPIIEAWDCDVRFLMIAGILSPEGNPSVFKTKVYDKIFGKYEVQLSYNRLLPKLFYDADLKLSKLKVNIQGQQTLLFFNDLSQVFKKFSYEDISKCKDPRGQKLSYYSGLDFLRHKMHGKVKAQVTLFEANVYPKRKFNRYDSYLNCSFSDIFYSQMHNHQEVALRNLTLSKLPLRDFESSMIMIPLIEIQIFVLFNQGKTVNHYTHTGVQNIGQVLDQLHAYSSHEVELDAKINIPSLGTRNDSDKETTHISQMVSEFVRMSPIPIAHYQRSHMKFFDGLLKEYLKKRDYSNGIPLKRDRGGKQNIKNKRTNLFKLRVRSCMNDLMLLFSDFKERLLDGYYFPQMVRADARQLKIQRDKYLAIYQGIIFSLENLCIKTQISVSKQKEGKHVEMKNSGIQGSFLKLAFLNSSNLFQIRHQCFKQLRDRIYEQSMDNPRHFWSFFEINPSQPQSSQTTSFQELQGNQVLSSFKTINPLYVLKTPKLLQEIMIATLNPQAQNPFSGKDQSQSILDDFVFANNDTIATILQVSYEQDKEILFYHNSTSKLEEKLQARQRAQNPLLMDAVSLQLEEERFLVKHMIDVNGIRFLYTKQTVELIYHHLVVSFDYERFRKTDFIDLENSQDRFSRKPHTEQSSSTTESQQTPINVKMLKKVALIGIRVEDPQFNFQNQFTKSQMLLTTAQPTTAIIFGYQRVNESADHATGLQVGHNNKVSKSKAGFKLKFHQELVKFDLQIQVVEMDIYVAPTVINLENPTFWITAAQPVDTYFSQSDNLLRKIIQVSNVSFTFDFFFAQFVDVLNPVMSIDILVEKLESDMSGPNMWHFVYVLKSILFDRGEKAEEILLTEAQRQAELVKETAEKIKGIINYKLNQNQQQGHKNIINKKIQYTILNGEFKLQNYDLVFSRVDVKGVSGTHLIYKNRNSKVDIDIDKILIENFADSEAYRTVLQGTGHQSAEAMIGSGDAMIKIRTRDKYIVVKEAPWRVYDQFEVFIYPTNIQFTKNFYQHIKSFFFAEMPNLDLDRSMEEIKKYELLVPKKVINKAKAKFKAKAKDSNDSEQVVLSAGADGATLRLAERGSDFYMNNLNAAMHPEEPYYQHDQRPDVAAPDDNIPAKEKKQEFPIFFRYTRMNEIIVSITYFHKKNSFFNSKDLKIKITPFIRHGKFVNFKKLFEKYEHHCKHTFIKQIPSLIKQKFLQTRENFTKGEKVREDDDDDEKLETKKQMKIHNARRILFGEVYH